MKLGNTSIRRSKVAVFLAALAPAIWLGWRGLHNHLGANPIETVTHFTGDWALRFLLITLLVTPMRRLLGMPELVRFRRMLGLFAFFYGSLHFLAYFVLDKFFDLNDIGQDIVKRKFITVGLAGLLLMVPLAVTSTAGWIRRLGGRRWQIIQQRRLILGLHLSAPTSHLRNLPIPLSTSQTLHPHHVILMATETAGFIACWREIISVRPHWTTQRPLRRRRRAR